MLSDGQREMLKALESRQDGLVGWEVFVEDVDGGHTKITLKKAAVTRIWVSNGKTFEAYQLPLFQDDQAGT